MINCHFYLSNKIPYGVDLENLAMNKHFKYGCCQLNCFTFVALYF